MQGDSEVVDDTIDDNTIKKCISLAGYRGCGRLEVVNLFAYRVTDPKQLPKDIATAIGPENDIYIGNAVKRTNKIVLAWGNKGTLYNRDKQVINILSGYELYCLRIVGKGNPGHPLYVRGNTNPIPFSVKR